MKRAAVRFYAETNGRERKIDLRDERVVLLLSDDVL